ncbi:MAG: site-specific integrase [Vulcanimicrobiota bacterium]
MARKDGLDRGLYEKPKGSGVWYVLWYDQMGKRHREKAGSKPNARTLYQKRKTGALQAPKLPELNRREITVGDLIDLYAEEMGQKKSAAWDARHAKTWKEEIGKISVGQLLSGDIERIKAKWRKKAPEGSGLSDATVNRRLAFLKRVFNLGLRDNRVTTNPVGQGRVKMLKESDPPDRFLTPEEEARILARLGRFEQLAMTIALHTGLRISEQVIGTRAELRLDQNLFYILEAKGGGRQEVRLNPVARAAFEELLTLHDSAWLFPDGSGKGPIDRGVLSRRFARAVKALEIQDVTWHTLRHTFISRLVMLGIPIVTVQKLARHKSLSMTLRYAHLAPDHMNEALDRLSATYGQQPL